MSTVNPDSGEPTSAIQSSLARWANGLVASLGDIEQTANSLSDHENASTLDHDAYSTDTFKTPSVMTSESSTDGVNPTEAPARPSEALRQIMRELLEKAAVELSTASKMGHLADKQRLLAKECLQRSDELRMTAKHLVAMADELIEADDSVRELIPAEYPISFERLAQGYRANAERAISSANDLQDVGIALEGMADGWRETALAVERSGVLMGFLADRLTPLCSTNTNAGNSIYQEEDGGYHKDNLPAMMMYTTGNIADPECYHCQMKEGPFIKCVVVPGFYGGSCTNCVWGGLSLRCSLSESKSTRVAWILWLWTIVLITSTDTTEEAQAYRRDHPEANTQT